MHNYNRRSLQDKLRKNRYVFNSPLMYVFNAQDTVVKKYNTTQCSTTYQKECTLVKALGENNGVTTRQELRCTCDVCTTVMEECNCNQYNVCEKCPVEKCHTGETHHTRSGCANEVCKTVDIHRATNNTMENCVEKPIENCEVVELQKATVVPVKDCNHIPTNYCVQVKKIRQKKVVYPECNEVTNKGCKTVHIYITKPVVVEDCKAITKNICSYKPKRVCRTIKTQVCGGHKRESSSLEEGFEEAALFDLRTEVRSAQPQHKSETS